MANFECHACRSVDLLILLRSILAIKAPEQLQTTLKEVVQLSLKRPQELSPAHMCLLISKAANFGFDIPYKKLQVLLLQDFPPIPSTAFCIFSQEILMRLARHLLPSLHMLNFPSFSDTVILLLCLAHFSAEAQNGKRLCLSATFLEISCLQNKPAPAERGLMSCRESLLSWLQKILTSKQFRICCSYWKAVQRWACSIEACLKPQQVP